MSLLTETIKIKVKIGNIGSTATSFENILYISNTSTTAVNDVVVRTYFSLEEVLANYAKTTHEYKAAVSHFTQNTHPDKFSIVQVAQDDVTLTYNAASNDLQDDFYAVIINIKEFTDDEIIELSTLAQEAEKIFLAGGDGATIIDPDESNVFTELKALNNDRTIVSLNNKNIDNPLMPAIAAEMLSREIGSDTWGYTSLVNVIADADLTKENRVYFKENNINYYTNFNGRPVFLWGKTVTGQWIDVILGMDSLKFDIRKFVGDAFIDSGRMNYQDKEGLVILRNVIEKAMKKAVRNNIITEKYTIFIPPAASQTDANVNNRIVDGIKIKGQLTNAIHGANFEIAVDNSVDN